MMRPWFLRFTLLTWAIVFPAYPRIDYNSPSQMKKAPTWQERQSALHEVLNNYPLSNTAMQTGVVTLLERESNDPSWGDLEEEIPYEDYYQELSDLCWRIAENYHNKAAWHALVHSNYNADSKFGLELVAQPEALRFFLEMVNSQLEVERDRATVALAEALARCFDVRVANCEAVSAKRKEILSIIRAKARSPDPTFAIVALGICGTAQDLQLLEELSAQQYPKGVGLNDATARASRLAIIHRAEEQVKERNVSKSVNR